MVHYNSPDKKQDEMDSSCSCTDCGEERNSTTIEGVVAEDTDVESLAGSTNTCPVPARRNLSMGGAPRQTPSLFDGSFDAFRRQLAAKKGTSTPNVRRTPAPFEVNNNDCEASCNRIPIPAPRANKYGSFLTGAGGNPHSTMINAAPSPAPVAPPTYCPRVGDVPQQQRLRALRDNLKSRFNVNCRPVSALQAAYETRRMQNMNNASALMPLPPSPAPRRTPIARERFSMPPVPTAAPRNIPPIPAPRYLPVAAQRTNLPVAAPRNLPPVPAKRHIPPIPAPRNLPPVPAARNLGPLPEPRRYPTPAPRNLPSIPAPRNHAPTPAPRNLPPIPASRNLPPIPAPRNHAPTPAPRNLPPIPALRSHAPTPAPRNHAPTPAPRNMAPTPAPRTNVPSAENQPCNNSPTKPSYCGPSGTTCQPLSDARAILAMNGITDCGSQEVEVACNAGMPEEAEQEEDCAVVASESVLTIDPEAIPETASASYYIPNSVYGEVCIKTPCQVDIIHKDAEQQGMLKPLDPCALHNHRFKYTQYANVHHLYENMDNNNCTGGGVQMFNHGGVPSLCGKCVPSGGNAANGTGCSAGGYKWRPRSYEEIKRECEQWAKEREEREKRTHAEVAHNGEVAHNVSVIADHKEEPKKETLKTNFMALIKDFTNAIGNGGAQGHGNGSPEIIVTPPTPTGDKKEGEFKYPATAKTAEISKQPTPERELLKCIEKIVAAEEKKKDELKKPSVHSAQMFSWPKSQQPGMVKEGRDITPSDCGFCKSLADIRMSEAVRKMEEEKECRARDE